MRRDSKHCPLLTLQTLWPRNAHEVLKKCVLNDAELLRYNVLKELKWMGGKAGRETLFSMVCRSMVEWMAYNYLLESLCFWKRLQSVVTAFKCVLQGTLRARDKSKPFNTSSARLWWNKQTEVDEELMRGRNCGPFGCVTLETVAFSWPSGVRHAETRRCCVLP